MTKGTKSWTHQLRAGKSRTNLRAADFSFSQLFFSRATTKSHDEDMTVTFGRDTAHMMYFGLAKNGMCVATPSFCEMHFVYHLVLNLQPLQKIRVLEKPP